MFSFGAPTFDAKDIPDLTGKVAIVTGGNTGIGYETTLHLALHGAKVYLAARSQSKALAAIEKIKSIDPSVHVEYLPMDLAQLSSVLEAAKRILHVEKVIDILVCNAGAIAPETILTDDGIEMDFQVNYLGHFYFTRLLLELVSQSADGRIVMLASDAYEKYTQDDMTFESLANINMDRTFLKRYGQSKLATILYTRTLANKLSHQQIFVNSVNPGDVATDMLRNVFSSFSSIGTWLYDRLHPLFFVTPYKGALTSLYAATSPEIRVQNLRGVYFNPIAKVGEVHGFAKDDRRAEALWNLSESILKERGFEIPRV